MAFRSVLGKMGTTTMTMASSKCIHKNRRLVLMLHNCEAEAHKKNHNHTHGNNKKAPVVRTAANAYLFEFGCIDENGFRIPLTVNRVCMYVLETFVVLFPAPLYQNAVPDHTYCCSI